MRLESAHVSLRNVLYSTTSHNMLLEGDGLDLKGLLSKIPQLPLKLNHQETTSCDTNIRRNCCVYKAMIMNEARAYIQILMNNN
jgi:hypothetical protein